MTVAPASRDPAFEATRKNVPWLSRSVKTFVCLAFAHTMVDCCQAVWPIFKKLAGLDLALAGMVATITIFIAQIMQPIFGLLADHGHRHRLLRIAMCLVCLPMLLGPLSQDEQFISHWSGHLTMFAIVFGCGLGSAMFHPSGISLAGEAVKHRRSTLVSLFIAFGMIGMGSSHWLFSTVFKSANRHTELLLIPAALIIVWVFRWCRVREQRLPGPLGVAPMLRRVAKLFPRLTLLWLVQVAITVPTSAAFVFLMPELVAHHSHGDIWIYGGAFAVFMAGAAIMMVPIGHLADRFGSKRVLATCLLLGTGTFYLLVLGNLRETWLFLAVLALTGGLLGSTNPLVIAIGQRLAGSNQSLVTGILMGFAWAAASPAQWISGAMAKQPDIGPHGAAAWLGIGLFAALLMVGFVPATQHRFAQES